MCHFSLIDTNDFFLGSKTAGAWILSLVFAYDPELRAERCLFCSTRFHDVVSDTWDYSVKYRRFD